MTGPVQRFRTLPLRSRLALLVASAVAIAVTAVAVACWLLTRTQLPSELDSSLENSTAPRSSVQGALAVCNAGTNPDTGTTPGFVYIQVVLPGGQRCVAPGSEPVKVQQEDLDVANGTSHSSLHDSVTEDGAKVRVFTRRVDYDAGPPITVSLSRPLAEIDASLNELALLLALVAGVGVIGAGLAGLWVARSGLRPVDGLTRAVEHVARTEDLTVRIPVEGEDEIARLSRSFNSMTAALASSRDRQSQLIADAGHELRTPLTSLRTNVELLARSEETGRAIPPADRRALMASVKAQMTELASLIGDLQELSRPDGTDPGPLQVVALHEIMGSALERARLRGPDLTITTDLRPWYVRAEPASLERALVNVLDNAVKFSPSGGSIEVTLNGGQGGNGELTVRDHGPGIPAEELPHVFERFWRSPSARALPGSGLGLSIVARTVQQAGGEIALRQAAGGGTVAAIRIPGAPTPPPDGM
ncbi:HAMP domain-containing sensor histidine kinase [Streptomyces sp. NPDC101062]|uniref:sensor histidine kinase n=1 Tax=unclassified Streptomyces TaxID=2593676 RepID=UPI002E782190|nr:HAMP domain-containing sensor histidine kinase [Streptomyces sp. JV176]MEE1800350.1 HAMP domain-containing sensor histidine kinase [Streptomyces sp. JV176]